MFWVLEDSQRGPRRERPERERPEQGRERQTEMGWPATRPSRGRRCARAAIGLLASVPGVAAAGALPATTLIVTSGSVQWPGGKHDRSVQI